MSNQSMIYGGFDLSFIDIDVIPLNQNNLLINELPPLGSHHKNTRIEFKPGGNGFNLCRTIGNLGRNVTYVGPSSPFFESLVRDNNIPVNIFPIIDTEPSYTSILNMSNGEIQFNSVKQFLSFQHISEDIIEKFRSSLLKPISNVSLNDQSIEWTYSLLLSLVYEDPISFVKESTNIDKIREKIHRMDFEGILLIDPSDLVGFNRLKEFCLILKDLRNFHGDKFLSVNESEIYCLLTSFDKSLKELSDYLNLPIIVHTPNYVQYEGKQSFKLKTLEIKKALTFVGAGDCFNGAFVHSLLNSNSLLDSLQYAIESATYLITTGSYPT